MVTFVYDRRGFGEVTIEGVEKRWRARTGSIDRRGELVNPIDPEKDWCLAHESVDTNEDAMVKEVSKGWKIRLWIKIPEGYRYTHYLIHPDAGRPGTKGCIGTEDSALDLRELLDNLVRKHNEVPVTIRKEA